MASTSDIYLPGQPLPLQPPLPLPGSGTYSRGGLILSGLVGRMTKEGSSVSIQSHHQTSSIPQPNSVVIGTINRLTPLQATLAITAVDGHPTGEEFQGVIRVQDVRSTEKDKVKIIESFRLGDVVRALVISLGDARSYYLSTARNDLGVIFATSEGGAPLKPVSWQEMACSSTGKRERRKVAKPDGI
ncbi:Exosomal 3'-5' exoribonuclease complex, subunit ski4 (Csl4) [Phaffia rhodozyma]|uniref:Exosomal 3'-5' exoribonuclease complex, subunit ski4 (Csl4) n=1 Tax=Phaffia rhodozyma TaxID=264483 RepID=A0A0F7SEF9_PHARH|nr:Exosomal 3'-5' exoribonuclease complex, subunit ski4 (Csl4) [Phaffia rhodozyma]